MTVTVQVVNTSGKDIRAIKGRVVFSTRFGDPLNYVTVENDHGIRAGGQWTDTSTYTVILTDQEQLDWGNCGPSIWTADARDDCTAPARPVGW